MFGWLAARSFFIRSIQAFWLVALAARREDRDLAGVADLLGDQVDLDLGDALGGGLVDEQVAAVGVGVGVEGDDLDAGRRGPR